MLPRIEVIITDQQKVPKLTSKQRNLDSDQLYFNITCCEDMRFSAERIGFLIGCFLMQTMGRTVEPSNQNFSMASRISRLPVGSNNAYLPLIKGYSQHYKICILLNTEMGREIKLTGSNEYLCFETNKSRT